MAVIVTVSDSVLDVGNDGVGVGLYAALNNRALKEWRRRRGRVLKPPDDDYNGDNDENTV